MPGTGYMMLVCAERRSREAGMLDVKGIGHRVYGKRAGFGHTAHGREIISSECRPL